MNSIKKIKGDLIRIKNSIVTIKDSNCFFIMKHLLVVLDDIVEQISTLQESSNAKKNICKYCKTNETGSLDEDVLCKECQEIFGHSFFSEL